MSSYHPYDPFSPTGQWNSQGFLEAPTPRAYSTGPSPLPGSIESIPGPTEAADEDYEGSELSSQPQSHPETLRLLQFAEWDRRRTYDEDPPTCMHYSVDWRATRNRRRFAFGTVNKVVLAPSAFWDHVLKTQVNEAMARELSPGQRMEYVSTDVILSVTERTVRNVKIQLIGTNSDWRAVENVLNHWSPYFGAGKKLMVELSINYKADNAPSVNRSKDKRGRTCATTRMLDDLDAQANAIQEVTGHPPPYKTVYGLLHCDGLSCGLGPWCWVDPDDDKHYPLEPPDLPPLFEWVRSHNPLTTHADVPEHIRQQIKANEQLKRSRKKPKRARSPSRERPIHIHMPGHSQDGTLPLANGSLVHSSNVKIPSPLKIPGFRDDAIRNFCAWEEKRWRDGSYQEAIRKASEVLLAGFWDLELLYERQNYSVLIQNGVPEAIALRIVRDIPIWLTAEAQGSGAAQLV